MNEKNQEYLEINWKNTRTIWWNLLWKSAILSMLGGLLLGAFGGAVAGILGRGDLGGIVGGTLGYLASIPISLIIMRKTLLKEYNDFTIKLVRKGI